MSQITICKPLTFNFPANRNNSESSQSVSAWGFILNGIIDPESHLPVTLPRQQGTQRTLTIHFLFRDIF